jgi:hypothetical protein
VACACYACRSELSTDKLIDRLDAFYGVYVTILTEAIRDGYNIEKNKNDFNDVHF